jgi:hypothetical protein
MSQVLREWLDQMLHRVYPLEDNAASLDTTGYFRIPSSLMSDIFLCAPDLPNVDTAKFYIRNITVRRYTIEITLGYEDVDEPIGTFRDIRSDAPLHTAYQFTPAQVQTDDDYAPLFFMTGQIIIGDPTETIQKLGSWTFTSDNTRLLPIRIGRGVLNVRYLKINDRLFTGAVKLREGANVRLEVTTEGSETVITVSASLRAGSALQIDNDADMLAALIADYGRPIVTINGMYPDVNRSFQVLGADCTEIQNGDHNVVISNPCATPCCDHDAAVQQLLESITNLNLRYAQLKAYFDAQGQAVNVIQNKLLVLGAEI